MNSNFITRDRCPCCDSDRNATIYQLAYSDKLLKNHILQFYKDLGPGVEYEYLDGVDYIVQECNVCNAVFQRDVPGPELMERLYEYWIDPEIVYKSHFLNRSVSSFRYASNHIAAAIDATLKKPVDVKFLDVGMGWGSWSSIAKAYGCDVYGSELSTTRIKNAEKLGIKILDPEQIQNMKFDVINIEQVLEHLESPGDLLASLKQSLNADGIIRVGVPMCSNIKRRLSDADWGSSANLENPLNVIAPLQHINFYADNALLVMGHKAGLEKHQRKNTTQGGIVRRTLRTLKHSVKGHTANILQICGNDCLSTGRVLFRHTTG